MPPIVAFSDHTSIRSGWSAQLLRRYDRFTVSTNAAGSFHAEMRSGARVSSTIQFHGITPVSRAQVSCVDTRFVSDFTIEVIMPRVNSL